MDISSKLSSMDSPIDSPVDSPIESLIDPIIQEPDLNIINQSLVILCVTGRSTGNTKGVTMVNGYGLRKREGWRAIASLTTANTQAS